MNLDAPISEIMTTKLLTSKPDDAVQVLYEIFDENRLHHVPIINKKEEVVGIISKSDFLYLLRGFTNNEVDRFIESAKLRAFKVEEIMEKEVVVINVHEPIRAAVSILAENRFRCLPVVSDENKLVGIITTHDIIDMVNEM